ncbi:MAG: fasciclin domain-containing protein [Candidatus Poseidoniaceae archaeon]
MQRKLATALIALLLISVLPTNVTADSTEDIPTNAAATGVHDSLVAALAHAGLVDTLAGTGPFTVFAPTDQAFADAGIDLASFDTDAENQTLVDILTYHVVSGSVMSTDIADAATTDALNGDKLSFTVGATEVKVNDAVVTSADVGASNGVIHVIDKVLMPPVDIYVSDGSMESPYFSFFADEAGADLVTELNVDMNYKFQRISNPSAHPFYVGDSGYNADSSNNLIIAGDGTSTTGISDDESFTLFFRDGFSAYDTLSYFCTVHSSMISEFSLTVSSDIPTVAAGTGIHNSLVTALTAANLVATLQGDGPFTVFAPTDDAFAAAGIDLTSSFNNEEIAQLTDILTYHVVAAQVLAGDLSDGMTASTVYPGNLTFTVNSDGVMVNDANVISANVPASNGVIHVIDKVLMPPTDLVDIPTVATETGIHTALVAALAQAELVATLQGDGPFTVFAPTDDAFAAAGIDLSTFDTDEENATLVDILTYHVVASSVMSSDLTDGMAATAFNTDSLTFTVSADGVMVNDANVVSADVLASNGVVHVIDKVLMPPTDDIVTPEDDCDLVVGITSDGYGFSPASAKIDVGDTVCWQWTNEGMQHNVKEVDGMKSTTYVENGVYSGTEASTVDFKHTFTEDTTFYYACVPHIGMEMFGKITVGEGTPEPAEPEKEDKKDNNTPGFLGTTAIIATLGAVLFARMRQEDEL